MSVRCTFLGLRVGCRCDVTVIYDAFVDQTKLNTVLLVIYICANYCSLLVSLLLCGLEVLVIVHRTV